MSKYFEIKGLDKTLKQLKALGKDGEKAIEKVVSGAAQEIATDAKQNVRAIGAYDLGKLIGSILPRKINDLNWKIVVGADYGAYIEFGTGGRVSVPAELKDIAIKFKGAGVKEINLQARPYLYPAYLKGKTQFLKDLELELENLTKKI